ncbi:MAG: acyl-CoA thioesterase [Eggerthellaceae bacterium]|nr:acyl-CoA thioesterase [Eggerthellaceae bacterium]MDR2721287.1 acyl-CoA thioesterase [Coriobacteriaceae bacterium]
MIAETKIKVRYAETDKMGVVYHANYLIWFEVGRTDFLEALGFPYHLFEEKGLMSPVVHAEINYATPVRYGETALVRTRLVELSGVKSVFQYEVFAEGADITTEKPCCTGKTVHCFVAEDTFKPLSIKKDTPELYQAYLEVLEP